MDDQPSESFNQQVKNYLDRRFSRENSLLHFIRNESKKEELPGIHIPIHLGKFISLIAKIQNSKRILEIGALSGYSTTWLAQALPLNGYLLSLELNEQYAKKACRYFQKIEGRNIDIRVGYAVDLLVQLVCDKEKPFDFIFIDADKKNNALYLEWSLKLCRPGSLILIDNLIPKGPKIGYPSHHEAQTVYQFNDYLAQHPCLEVAALPTLVEPQGRIDAFAIAYVKEIPQATTDRELHKQ